jgi:translation initiation factor IF-2
MTHSIRFDDGGTPDDATASVGRALVREVSTLSDIEPMAQCYVTSGIISRFARLRIIRDGLRIYGAPGQQFMLEMLQDDTSGRETEAIAEGRWCILRLRGFQALRTGDVVEAYKMQE